MFSYRNPVLIVTSQADKTSDYVENILRKRGYSVYRLNTDRIEEYDISFTADCNGYEMYISHDVQGKLSFENVKSIYFRKPTLPKAVHQYHQTYHRFMQDEFLTFLLGMITSFDGLVLTDPYILKRANNKLLQMKVAEKIGFKIPDTIVGTSIDRVFKFISLKSKTVVKPLSHGRISENELVYTSIVDRNINLDDLRSLSISPHIFQKFIEKEADLRLTVVGEKVFPVRIDSDNNIDWRLGKNKYSVVEVPDDIVRKCKKYMKTLNLNFCAFDFVLHDGNYYFLEANPNGQWLWLELELGIPIAEEIVRTLTGEQN